MDYGLSMDIKEYIYIVMDSLELHYHLAITLLLVGTRVFVPLLLAK